MARREERELTENKDDMSEAALVRGAHDTRQRLTGRTEFKFEIGKIVSSEKLLDQMEKTKKLMLERNKTPGGSFSSFVWNSFARHCLCDWGDLSQEDREANNQALKTGSELFSTYNHTKYPTICILTEADRSETAIGLQDDFC